MVSASADRLTLPPCLAFPPCPRILSISLSLFLSFFLWTETTVKSSQSRCLQCFDNNRKVYRTSLIRSESKESQISPSIEIQFTNSECIVYRLSAKTWDVIEAWNDQCSLQGDLVIRRRAMPKLSQALDPVFSMTAWANEENSPAVPSYSSRSKDLERTVDSHLHSSPIPPAARSRDFSA